MKRILIAAFLLAALTGWIFPPAKTVASQKEIKFQYQNKQVELARESVIHKPKNEVLSVHQQFPVILKPTTATQKAPAGVRANTPSRNSINGGWNNRAVETADKEAVKALIIRYSEQYGIDAAVPLCIAYYESGYNSASKNKSSSARGVFQYLSGTWAGTDEGKAGLSVYDADANVRAAIKYMASRRSTAPWEVRNKCPKVTPL